MSALINELHNFADNNLGLLGNLVDGNQYNLTITIQRHETPDSVSPCYIKAIKTETVREKKILELN